MASSKVSSGLGGVVQGAMAGMQIGAQIKKMRQDQEFYKKLGGILREHKARADTSAAQMGPHAGDNTGPSVAEAGAAGALGQQPTMQTVAQPAAAQPPMAAGAPSYSAGALPPGLADATPTPMVATPPATAVPPIDPSMMTLGLGG